jgi:hypothetical protein
LIKLNLGNGTNNIELEGKAVVAIVIEPSGHDADYAALMVGESSPHIVAKAAGVGIGSIVSKMGRNTFDRAMLASTAIGQIKNAINGEGIKEEDVVKEKIFEGRMEGWHD